MKRQRRLFTNFCNAKLCDRDDVPPITDVFEDLRDGRVLYALLEELSGQSLAPLGRIKKPKKGKQETRIDHVSNLSICFRYIKQTTKTVGIGPSDIADGKPTMVLGLLWSIIVFFTSKDLGGVDDISALKKKILKWCQKRTEANKDVEIRNLKDSFMDGRAFLAIVSDVDPDGFPYAPAPDACANFSSAFAEARAKYGVPELLDGDDADVRRERGLRRALQARSRRRGGGGESGAGDARGAADARAAPGAVARGVVARGRGAETVHVPRHPEDGVVGDGHGSSAAGLKIKMLGCPRVAEGRQGRDDVVVDDGRVLDGAG